MTVNAVISKCLRLSTQKALSVKQSQGQLYYSGPGSLEKGQFF